MIKLLALDMDGTLLNEAKEIPQAHITAIHQAIEKGVKLVLCTGRPLFGVLPYYKKLGLDLQNEYKCMAEGIVQWTDLPTQFLAGEVAMIYHTTGNMANIHDNADFDFGTAFLPAHKRVGAPTGGGNFYISSNISEDRVQAAWKFIKFATSTDRAAQWSLDTGYVATRQSCFDTDLIKDYYAEVPQASVAYEQLPYAKPELTTYNAAEIWRVLNDNIQAAVVGDMSAQEALDAAQEQAEEVLSEYQ